MALVTRTSLAIEEDQDRLTFRIERKRGWLEQALGMGVVIAFLWMAHQANSVLLYAFALIGAGGILADQLNGPTTELIVTREQLTAQGNLGRSFSTELAINASSVDSFGYELGGEGELSGFYVRHGWARSCVLPNISEMQAAQVKDAILRKIPELAKSDRESGSLIFGTSEAITLGLSRRSQD